MNSTNSQAIGKADQEVLAIDPPVCVLKNLKVRALEPHEHQRAGQLLDREHYLGDVPQGRQLLQVIEYEGRWLALLDWGPASWKLTDREEWIGWTWSRSEAGRPRNRPVSARRTWSIALFKCMVM